MKSDGTVVREDYGSGVLLHFAMWSLATACLIGHDNVAMSYDSHVHYRLEYLDWRYGGLWSGYATMCSVQPTCFVSVGFGWY